MNKLNDILESIDKSHNILTVKIIENFNINSIIGYRIDNLIIRSSYEGTQVLADFLLKIMPNMTVAGVVKCKIYYCIDL